jgi:hypothetical protein
MEPAAEFTLEPLPPIDEPSTFGLPDGMPGALTRVLLFGQS